MQALREALQRDPRVFLMGEDVGRYGGCYAVARDCSTEFGPERIRDTPLSESASSAPASARRSAGMRPIVEIMTVNFSLLALDQIVNNAATLAPHVRRAVQRAAGDPHGDRRRPAAGRPALAQPRGLVRAHSRAASAGAGDGRGCARHALARAAGAGSGDHLRARVALQRGGARWPTPAPASTSTMPAIRAPAAILPASPTAAVCTRHWRRPNSSRSEGIDAEVIDLRSAAPARRRDDPRVGASHAPARDRRRGMAQRQPRRRDQRRASWSRRSTSSTRRCARLQRGGADSVCQAPGGRGAAEPGTNRSGRAPALRSQSRWQSAHTGPI